MEKITLSLAVPRPTFWEGIARIMDFPGLLLPDLADSASVDDAQALAADWAQLGQEFGASPFRGEVDAILFKRDLDAALWGPHHDLGDPYATRRLEQERLDLADTLDALPETTLTQAAADILRGVRPQQTPQAWGAAQFVIFETELLKATILELLASGPQSGSDPGDESSQRELSRH